jgi:hypothetical protein
MNNQYAHYTGSKHPTVYHNAADIPEGAQIVVLYETQEHKFVSIPGASIAKKVNGQLVLIND